MTTFPTMSTLRPERTFAQPSLTAAVCMACEAIGTRVSAQVRRDLAIESAAVQPQGWQREGSVKGVSATIRACGLGSKGYLDSSRFNFGGKHPHGQSGAGP